MPIRVLEAVGLGRDSHIGPSADRPIACGGEREVVVPSLPLASPRGNSKLAADANRVQADRSRSHTMLLVQAGI
jgi:hypothetical protein